VAAPRKPTVTVRTDSLDQRERRCRVRVFLYLQ
jgi:hypothetical protein